jgi:hypothetical protein
MSGEQRKMHSRQHDSANSRKSKACREDRMPEDGFEVHTSFIDSNGSFINKSVLCGTSVRPSKRQG